MLLKNLPSKIHGFTLPEVIIALAINAFLMIALVIVFMANLDHYNNLLNNAVLSEQMQTAMDIISGDIRRAGYWANAANDIGNHTNTNPFMASGADISVGGTGNSCILLTYDHDNNGSLPAISSSYDDERYGYRLNGSTLQARPPGATFSCNASASSWENMTDSNVITMTALTFTLNTQTITAGPGTRGIIIRSVDITMTGQLASDSTVTKTLTRHIRIRNDKYTP